jgi:hypothetical protein
MAIAFICGIAALTIAVAIVTNKLLDSQAWLAVAFFAAVGAAAGQLVARQGSRGFLSDIAKTELF